jgi:hypothetical protein
MKKVLAIFAIVALASCGNVTSTEVNSDSTSVSVDTTKLDSTEVTVDSGKNVAPEAVEVK